MPTTSPLRPTAALNAVWSPSTVTLIDDVVTQPAAGGGDYAYASGDSSEIQQWACESPTTTGLITSAKLWVYLKFDSNSDGDISAVRIRLNGVWRAGTLSDKPSSGSLGWASCTVTGEYGELISSAPAFELTYTGATLDGEVYLDVAYIEITYDATPTISGAPAIEGMVTTDYSANQTTHTVNLPSGIESGDLLLLWFNKDGTSGTITTPSGWSIAVSTITLNDQSILFSKTATGSEGTTLSVSTSVNESSSSISCRISGWSEVVYAYSTIAATPTHFPPATIASETAPSLVLQFMSGAGSIEEPAEIPNGPITWTLAQGNTANSGNTVMALSTATVVSTIEDVEVFSFPVRFTGNNAGRWVSVAIHGTEPSGGGGVSDPLFAGLVL